MVLKPAHQQHTQQTTRVAIEDHSRQNRVGHSPSGVLTAGRVETAVHSDRSEERVAAHRGGAVNRPGERLLPPPNEATWASTVMTWGGFAATGTPPVPPSPEEVPDDPHAAPAWNEQSVFSSSGSAGGGGTGSAARSESLMQSTISVDGSDMTRSTISVLNGEAQRNAQGVANLLQTVRRLGKNTCYASCWLYYSLVCRRGECPVGSTCRASEKRKRPAVDPDAKRDQHFQAGAQ
jgi:hypothetical protein